MTTYPMTAVQKAWTLIDEVAGGNRPALPLGTRPRVGDHQAD
jgi:hypothetical protein